MNEIHVVGFSNVYVVPPPQIIIIRILRNLYRKAIPLQLILDILFISLIQYIIVFIKTYSPVTIFDNTDRK